VGCTPVNCPGVITISLGPNWGLGSWKHSELLKNLSFYINPFAVYFSFIYCLESMIFIKEKTLGSSNPVCLGKKYTAHNHNRSRTLYRPKTTPVIRQTPAFTLNY
jgi:hypothetical protein